MRALPMSMMDAANALNAAEHADIAARERLAVARGALNAVIAIEQDRARRIAEARERARTATSHEWRVSWIEALSQALGEMNDELLAAHHRIRCEAGTAASEAEKAAEALERARKAYLAAVERAA